VVLDDEMLKVAHVAAFLNIERDEIQNNSVGVVALIDKVSDKI